jgi:RNA polymerase sigma-70 factor (ECF subfamily)
MHSPTAPDETTPGRWHPGEIEDEEPSIDFLYTEYLDSVFSYVLYRVRNHTEAEDITAETFAAALTAIPRFRAESAPYAWLLGIARQKIAEAARRRDRTRQRELSEEELPERERETLSLLLTADIQQLPEDALLRKEARRVMRQLLKRLPEPQREALLLQVRHGLSLREIAQVMGRSEEAASSLLQRARATIFRHGRSYFEA